MLLSDEFEVARRWIERELAVFASRANEEEETMHREEGVITKRMGLHLFAVVILSFLVVILLASPAQAQWTTSNGNTTTTDKVGIGLTVPTGILDVGDVNIRLKVTTSD